MLIAGWIFFSIAAGMFARIRRDRNGVGWFVAAILFSPLVAFVLLAILPVRLSLAPVDNGRRLAGFVGLAVIWLAAIVMLATFA